MAAEGAALQQVRRASSSLPDDIAQVAHRSKFPRRLNTHLPPGSTAAEAATSDAAAAAAAEALSKQQDGAKIGEHGGFRCLVFLLLLLWIMCMAADEYWA